MKTIQAFGLRAAIALVLITSVMAFSFAQTGQAEGAERFSLGQRVDLENRIKNTINDHVLPRIISLKESTKQLSDVVKGYCQSDASPSLQKKLRTQFSEAVIAWANAQHLLFGPLTVKSRNVRIAFWPDPRGIVRRQLRRALANPEITQKTAQNVSSQSVALQGLPALEQLLLPALKQNADSGEVKAFVEKRCALAIAISANIAEISEAIGKEWNDPKGWHALLLSAGPDNPIYKSTEEAAAELVKSLVLALKSLHKNQVLVLQTAAEKKKRPTRLPFYKSAFNHSYLLASITAARDLYAKLNLDGYVKHTKPWLLKWLPRAAAALKTNAEALRVPTNTNYEPKAEEFLHVRNLERFSRGLAGVIATDLGPAAGLTIGFNQLDGD